MNTKKYFWEFNKEALAETGAILKNPGHSLYQQRMVTLLSRCDKPKEIFSLMSKSLFVERWPKIRSYWFKRERVSTQRDWWETIAEQLSEKAGASSSKSKGGYSVFFQNIGHQLKEARLARDLSQKDVAHRVDMEQPDVSKVEEGKKNITLFTLARLCKVLGIKTIRFP